MSLCQVRLPEHIIQTVQKARGDVNQRLVFGVPLEEVLRLDSNQGLLVPLIVHNTVTTLQQKGLQTEGIFRVSGNMQRVEELKKLYDAGEPVDLNEEKDPHVVASLLKWYIRELPEPLMTTELYLAFMQAYDKSNVTKSKAQIIETLKKLPEPNRILLKLLIILLAKIARIEDNKMNSANLAICFGPNLFRSTIDSPEIVFKHAPIYNAIIKLLIDEADAMISEL